MKKFHSQEEDIKILFFLGNRKRGYFIGFDTCNQACVFDIHQGKGNIMPNTNRNNSENKSKEEQEKNRKKGQSSGGTFEKGSERAREAGRKGGKASH